MKNTSFLAIFPFFLNIAIKYALSIERIKRILLPIRARVRYAIACEHAIYLGVRLIEEDSPLCAES
jgi:hypothetical protein